MNVRFSSVTFPIRDSSPAAGNPKGKFFVGNHKGSLAPMACVDGADIGSVVALATDSDNIVNVRLNAYVGKSADGRGLYLATLAE